MPVCPRTCGLVCLMALGALALPAAASPPPSPPAAPAAPAGAKESSVTEPCDGALQIDRGQSPWSGYTGSYEEEQAGFHIQARALDPSWEVPGPLAAFRVEDQALLAIDRKARRVYVAETAFSDLERVDATGLAPGERRRVGQLQGGARRMAPRRMVEFLLRSQLIRTYWHLGARLCPGAEQAGPPRYRLELRGTHEYCTQRCQESPLAFAVEIDSESGEITVVGL